MVSNNETKVETKAPARRSDRRAWDSTVVVVRGNDVSAALRALKRSNERAGLAAVLRRHAEFARPGERRRAKHLRAVKKLRAWARKAAARIEAA